MEPFDESQPERRQIRPSGFKTGNGHLLEKEPTPKHTPFSYHLCDGLTEGLLYFTIVFAPWAFGATQPWSVWTLNFAGYALGGLLALKRLIRWRTRYHPDRWGEPSASPGTLKVPQRSHRVLTTSLAVLTLLIIAYAFVGALNARATFLPEQRRFEYHDSIRWLPHSYDSTSTWNTLASYAALAMLFWAARDWLLGKTARERRASTGYSSTDPKYPASSLAAAKTLPAQLRGLPDRLRRLLWVLSVNGALVGLEGVFQRLDGTNKLLWLVEPQFNKMPESQFGPFAYRANAASFLNLIWPVCLGFWLVLNKLSRLNPFSGRRFGGGSHILLLPCVIVMAASAIICTSRGGALATVLLIIGAVVTLAAATLHDRPGTRIAVLGAFLTLSGLASFLAWEQLKQNTARLLLDEMSPRVEVRANARNMATDFSFLGSGAGTFGSLYLLYKEAPQQWAAYAHDDWLEARITLGWVGFSLILVMASLVALRWFVAAGGISAPWEFVATLWLALSGCLLHAKFDFPFQIHSIWLIFLVVCSILFCVSRRNESGSRTQ